MKNIIVYTTPTCPYCHAAKEFLSEHKVAFTDVDVSRDIAKAQEMVQKSGQMGVPVIDVDGEIIVGFNKARLAQLAGIKE